MKQTTDKWKRILWRLLFPGTFPVFLLFNISLGLLLYTFLGKEVFPLIAYTAYAISAYTLVTVCVRMPAIVKRMKAWLHKNPYTNRLLTDRPHRIRVTLYGGLTLNIGFAVFKVVVGILYQSSWLFAMAGYNTILSIMRFFLVRQDMRDLKEEKTEQERRLQGLRSYHVCGWLMLLLNSAISVIVIMVVFGDQTITYPGFMIYAIAAFAFYCLTMAIINMVRYWHRYNPLFAAVKRISMAKALVSVFTMQVAMLTQFGEGDLFARRMANGATGFVVCGLITAMAVLMLVGVKKDYKEYFDKERIEDNIGRKERNV